MTETEGLRRDMGMLRERLSRLSSASLAISERVDLNAVLREVVEGARTLTGARYSCLMTLDEAGQLQELVVSGMAAEERQRLLELPDGCSLPAFFRDIRGPLALADLPAHLGALGFPEDALPYKTFLGTPLRHRGGRVGNFFVAEKEAGGEFTGEDEDVLAVLAAQAAAALANDRCRREQQRARTDLKARIDTSPVGVAVFDARTGAVLSINRETTRIFGDLSV